MDTNAGLIIKLCVFALDIFIIIFNFITLKHYLPSFRQDKENRTESRNKAQQTYLAGGDLEPKTVEKRQNYGYRATPAALLNKQTMPHTSSYNRGNPAEILRNCQKYYCDKDRDYRREEKYARSICRCDFCKEGKRLIGSK